MLVAPMRTAWNLKVRAFMMSFDGVKCFTVVMEEQSQICVCGVTEDVVDVCRHLDVASVGVA